MTEMLATRTFDPELTGYQYPRPAEFLEFEDQDQSLRMAHMDAEPESVRAQLGNYPILGKAAAQAIPNAALVEIEGVGHLPQIEAFDQYSEALLRFLGSDDDL